MHHVGQALENAVVVVALDEARKGPLVDIPQRGRFELAVDGQKITLAIAPQPHVARRQRDAGIKKVSQAQVDKRGSGRVVAQRSVWASVSVVWIVGVRHAGIRIAGVGEQVGSTLLV